MLWGAHIGGLELRSEGGETRIRATFPYGRAATLSDGPRPRREVIAARAFAARIEAGKEIHLLSGHDYNRPLASRAAGTLNFRDTDAALEIEARIATDTSWAADFLAAHRAGLIRGLSRLPRPARRGGGRGTRRGPPVHGAGGGPLRGVGRDPARLSRSADRGVVLGTYVRRPDTGSPPRAVEALTCWDGCSSDPSRPSRRGAS